MNNSVSFFALMILIFSLASCNTDNSENKKVNVISIFKNHKEEISANDFVKNMQFIPLETTTNNTIGSIKKIIKTSEKYYILDSYTAKKLFIFDLKGHFLYQVGNTGRGPGEYIEPLDFSLDEKNNRIYILDASHKILAFAVDGTFIMEKPTPESCKYISNIQAINGQIIAYNNYEIENEKKYQIVIFDDNLVPENWNLPYKDGSPIKLSILNTLYEHDGIVNYVNPWVNTLYEEKDNTFRARYKFDFSGNELPSGLIKTPDDLINDKNHSYISDRFVEGDSLIFLVVYDKGRPKYGFLDKKTNKFLLADRLKKDCQPFIIPLTYYKGRFIGEMSSLLVSKKFPDVKLQESITANPVIVEYQISFNTGTF